MGTNWEPRPIVLREDSENLYFLMEVESAEGGNEDFGSVYLTAPSAEGLIEGDVWIKISEDGKHRTSIYRQGWLTSPPMIRWMESNPYFLWEPT